MLVSRVAKSFTGSLNIFNLQFFVLLYFWSSFFYNLLIRSASYERGDNREHIFPRCMSCRFLTRSLFLKTSSGKRVNRQPMLIPPNQWFLLSNQLIAWKYFCVYASPSWNDRKRERERGEENGRERWKEKGMMEGEEERKRENCGLKKEGKERGEGRKQREK